MNPAYQKRRERASRDATSRQPIRVSFDATEDVLARGRSGWASILPMVHDRELARALGRVLAHEIGHVLLGLPYHDAAGLMRAAFRPDELAERNRTPFRLSSAELTPAERLRVGRQRGRLRAYDR